MPRNQACLYKGVQKVTGYSTATRKASSKPVYNSANGARKSSFDAGRNQGSEIRRKESFPSNVKKGSPKLTQHNY